MQPDPASPDELLAVWRDAVRAAQLAERMAKEALDGWDDGTSGGIHAELNRLAGQVAKSAALTIEHASDATLRTEEWHHRDGGTP